MFIKKYFFIYSLFLVFTFSLKVQSQSLLCLNVFKESLNKRVAGAVVSYVKNPTQLLVRKSLREDDQAMLGGLLVPSITGEFKNLTHFGKINKVLSLPNQFLVKLLFKNYLNKKQNFSLAPLNFIRQQTFINPLRFITRHLPLLNREYEPSALLSFLSYIYYFNTLVLSPIDSFVQNQVTDEIDFLIINDYRYKSLLPFYNKVKMLESKLDSQLLRKKEVKVLEKELLFEKQRFLQALIHRKKSYEVFFSYLSSTNKKFPVENLLSSSISKKKVLEAVAIFKPLAVQLPALFIEWDQWSGLSKFSDLSGFVSMNEEKDSVNITEQSKNKILLNLIKKHIQQEGIKNLLYFSKSEQEDFSSVFSSQVSSLKSLSMYKTLSHLYSKKQITKSQFLRSMQEFTQWKFNFSIWKILGLQRLVIGKILKSKLYYTKEILTIDKIKQDILEGLKKLN